MPFPLMVKWVRAIALSALLLVPEAAPSLATAAVTGTLVFATPTEAWARSSSSSGGYSRSSSSSSRTPSVSGSSSSSRSSSSSGSYSRSSSSSSSGGYSRTPSTTTSNYGSGSNTSSSSDKAFSRQGSSDALKAYRDSQTPKTTTTTTNTNTTRPNTGSGWSWGGGNSGGGGSSNWSWGSGSRRGDTYRPPHGGSWSGWYNQRGWTPPAYVNQGRGFGIWEGVALYFLLDTLTSPGHAAFFHNHQNDPGLQEWRAEAEKQARDNAELKAKLASLDKSLAQMKDQPVDPNVLPSDIPVEVVTNKSAQESAAALRAKSEGGGGWFWIIVVLAAVLFLLWWVRRSMAARKKSSSEDESVRLGTIGNYVSQKLSGKPYEPKLFRVGMAVTIDPTPFLLAAGLTKVTSPEAGLTSIPAIGTVKSGNAVVYRLYLPESNGYFQLHLDKEGFPVECRYFTVIDEITPADAGEWGFWLDKNEGAIGWPDFQTKDGKVYPRTWTPGGSRVQPFKMREEMKDVKGTTTRSFDAMLYAAPTGAAAPAPQSEYILVTAIEADGQAWVEIAAGIDISPASLSLT